MTRHRLTAAQIHALDASMVDIVRADLVLRLAQQDAERARERADKTLRGVLAGFAGADPAWPWVAVVDGDDVFLAAEPPAKDPDGA